MARKDVRCVHEPFGDAFYYGPERLSERYEDEKEREKSGFAKTTYADVVEHLEKEDGYEVCTCAFILSHSSYPFFFRVAVLEYGLLDWEHGQYRRKESYLHE